MGRVGLTNGKAFMFRMRDGGQKGLLTNTVFHHEKTLAKEWSDVNDVKRKPKFGPIMLRLERSDVEYMGMKNSGARCNF